MVRPLVLTTTNKCLVLSLWCRSALHNHTATGRSDSHCHFHWDFHVELVESHLWWHSWDHGHPFSEHALLQSFLPASKVIYSVISTARLVCPVPVCLCLSTFFITSQSFVDEEAKHWLMRVYDDLHGTDCNSLPTVPLHQGSQSQTAMPWATT